MFKPSKDDCPSSASVVWNGYAFKRSANGEWEPDDERNRLIGEAAKEREKEAEHRRQLYWALRSRVLTLEEMREVERYDFYLVFDRGHSYKEADKRAEFNAALLQQFRLRLAKEEADLIFKGATA
jgi:hypothetical protein